MVDSAADTLKIVSEINERYLDKHTKKPKPVWENSLTYDSSTESLEPIYFWIIDFMQAIGLDTEKLVDNFTASPGSGYFAELGARASRMQEEGMKILSNVNAIIKSVLSLIYDLKEIEIRLKHYKDSHSKDEQTKESGILALKQIWMDNVDIKRGRGSINSMTYELQFTTLRDAFMRAKNLEDIDKMDLNDRVKGILKPRLSEFLEWWKRSEAELTKQYEVERVYLKSQVNSLKLYTRWVKPYLKVAEELRMKEIKTPSLVTAFNTMVLELVLLGKSEVDVKDEAENKNLPERFAKLKMRKYHSCVLLDFTFRGIPTRTAGGHYIHGGRATINFRAFALNNEELALFEKKLEQNEFKEALEIISGATEESLGHLQKDLEHYLVVEKKEEEKTEDVGPITALVELVGFRKPKEKEAEKQKKVKEAKEIKKDSYEESAVREFAEHEASKTCFEIFDIYKKAHDMASFESPFKEPGFEKGRKELRK